MIALRAEVERLREQVRVWRWPDALGGRVSTRRRAQRRRARDAVAAWLGVDDGPRGPVTWEVAQEIGKGYAVRITILGGAR